MTEADIDELLADIEQQVLQVGSVVTNTAAIYVQAPGSYHSLAGFRLLLGLTAAAKQHIIIIINPCKPYHFGIGTAPHPLGRWRVD
jgi:hypothetical protein